MRAVIDRGRPTSNPHLSRADLRALVLELSPRRTGEAIGVYQARIARNVSLLISAGLEPGNPLHRYLTRLQPFTSAADRPHALRHAAREALLQKAA